MFGDQQIDVLARLMDVAQLRARVHAGNLAHQNTPGYRARAVDFDAAFRDALRTGGAEAALTVEPTVFEPRTTAVQPDGNDVSTEREVMAMAQNQQLYNAFIAMTEGRIKLLTTAITPAPGG